MTKEMQISAERAMTKPRYGAAAAELLERCREFYQSGENEKDFIAWKEAQKKKGA